MNKSKLNNVITKFIEGVTTKHLDIVVEGILVFGSALDEKYFYKRSDVDLYIVIKDTGKRYRGVQVVDGIEVDYFVNPIEQLKKDFDLAVATEKKMVLFMLTEGKIIQDDSGEILKLQNKVKQIIKSGPSEMSQYQIHMAKYFINDYFSDVKDSRDIGDDFVWERNVNLLLNYLIETFCAFHKIYVLKPKYQREQFMGIDKKFVELYEDVTNSNTKLEKQKAIELLIQHLIDEMGGCLEQNWEIESKLM